MLKTIIFHFFQAFIQQIIEAHKKKHIEFLDCFGQKIAGDNNEELTKAVNNLVCFGDWRIIQ